MNCTIKIAFSVEQITYGEQYSTSQYYRPTDLKDAIGLLFLLWIIDQSYDATTSECETRSDGDHNQVINQLCIHIPPNMIIRPQCIHDCVQG